MLVFEAGLGLLAAGIGALVGVAPFATLRLALWPAVVGLLAALPMLLFFGALWLSRATFLHTIRDRVQRAIRDLFAHASLVELAAVSAAAGFGEEAFFRGLLQGGLQQAVGPWPALLAASVAFGLVHPVSRAYVVIASVVGVYLGGLWWWSDNLLTAMIAHGFYDFVALIAIARATQASDPSRAPSVYVDR